MIITKPAIVLVPGAWHVPRNYSLLTSRLEESGYDVHCLSLPSMEDATIDDNWKEDVKLVSRTVEQLADQGREVLIVMHSRGGLVGSDAAKDLSSADRAKEGKQGGVVGMVYLAAFACPEGPWTKDALMEGLPKVTEVLEGTICRAINVHENFYGDLSADVAQEQSDYLRDMHVGFVNHEVTYAAWRHIPSTYLVCEDDMAIPLGFQEAMIARPGASFTVERCKSAHSPFLSMPEFTANIVRRAAGEKI